jgi:hypothetical protein
MNTVTVFEIPNYLICGKCGYAMQALPAAKRKIGKTAYSCQHGACPQFDQPFWHYYREVTLDDKVNPDELV